MFLESVRFMENTDMRGFRTIFRISMWLFQPEQFFERERMPHFQDTIENFILMRLNTETQK